MPMVRYQIRNEYGLSDPQLYGAAEKDDPEALLEGVAMAGLVGLLRQLGDLSEFAAEIFHDLHEEVMATASRGHGLTLRLHQLEAEFPSVEEALISQINLPNVTQNEGIQWHTNVQIDQNLITSGDMPRFVMDSYEECRGPPRLFTLDKFDVAGAGACLKRYSDPSFFKTELASSYSIETEDAPREGKPRKIKKKAISWKKGETLELLLTSSSESPASSETQSSGKVLLSRVVKLKSRRLRTSDNNTRKIYHSHLLELIESEQKIVLEDSRRQSKIKPDSNGRSKQACDPVSFVVENELQKMNKVYPIQEQNEASSGSENIKIGFETSSSSQTREKTMTDSDDIASEHDNFVDAPNTIEMEMETDNESKSKSDAVSSSQKEMMHENLHSDSVGGLSGTDKGSELNGEIEYGEATEEFFGNDDLMDVSSTSSLHSDGVHQTQQLSISHGNNLMVESKVPADDNENELGALLKSSALDEAQLGFEDLVRLPNETPGCQKQTNFHPEYKITPITDSSPEISEISGVILNPREIKFLEETPILEDSLGTLEENKYLTNNRSPVGPEELEEPLVNPIEVSQVELRNISEEILNLEEYLISTRKDESISRDVLSHGGKDVGNYANATETLDVHAEETTQDFNEDKFEDPNERLQHEHSAELEDVLNGEGSVVSKKDEEIVPGNTASIPTDDTTDLSTQMTGLDLAEALCEIRIQPNKDPRTFTSDDYLDNGRSTSNHELEASSREPNSPISIPEETSIQGSYPKYHMDFIEPDEGLLDLGETKKETYRDESSQHCVVETQTEQFNESEDGLLHLAEDEPLHLDENESVVLLIDHELTDKSLQGVKNAASKLHGLSVDGDDSLEVFSENSFCRSIYVKEDRMQTNNLASFSPNGEYEMWVGDFKVGEKEEGSPRERIFELELGTKPTSLGQTDAVHQTDVALGSPHTSLKVGDHQVPEKETEMELCYMGEANNVHGACEEELFVEDDSAHANVAAASIEVNKLLEEEDLETKYLEIEEGKLNNEVFVECSKLNEEGSAVDGEPIPCIVKTEVLGEAFRNDEQENAERGLLASPVVTTEAFVEFLKLNEDSNGNGSLSTPLVMKNGVLAESLKNNEKDSVEDDVGTSPVLMKNEVLVESLKNNEKDGAEGDVGTSPVLNNEALVEIMGLNEECNGKECNAKGGVPKPIVLENEVPVEALNINEKDGVEGFVLASFAVSNEVLVETSDLKEEDNVEGPLPLPLVVKSEVLVEAFKTDEKDGAEGSVSTSSLLNNLVPVEIFESNDKDNCEVGVPIPFVDHVHELLQNKESKIENEVPVESINEKEEEGADTGLPSPSVDLVHEILQEPTNLSCQEPDTPPSSTYEECHHESVGYADLVVTIEVQNITRSCTISLDNPLFHASPCENLSDESSELHSNKPVPHTNLHSDQEKLQEDINQIATEILCNASTSETWTVDPNKSTIAESFGSSSVVKDQKVPQEGFNLKSGSIFSGNESIDEDLVRNTLANKSVETKGSELDMCSAYSLASEHKPPPLPPLGWRMGGKLLKGTSLPSNEHSSISNDEMNPKPLVHMRSMEAPPIANHADSGRVEGEKLRVMSLSDLPPLSCQHDLRNPNLMSVPFSGENVQNVDYTNGSSDVRGLTGPEMRASQYAWPDAQHPHPFLPVSAWTTRPSLVQVNQPGYLISLEDNLWAQYGIGTPVEDERLIRKHHSIRNMPRNPLMDAVAAHDRSTMRKVSELVKPDDESKADDRNSLLEQIRNKSFSLRPVGAQKTTSAKAPQTNLKVAAIVEKANAIRQAFVGSDEEDGDSWSDA